MSKKKVKPGYLINLSNNDDTEYSLVTKELFDWIENGGAPPDELAKESIYWDELSDNDRALLVCGEDLPIYVANTMREIANYVQKEGYSIVEEFDGWIY